MEDPALERIVAGVLRVLRPERILLFGSRARGDHAPDSDYDVLVIARPEGVRPWQVRRAIGSVGVGVDVVMTTPEEADYWRDGVSHLLTIAQREGRTLYAA